MRKKVLLIPTLLLACLTAINAQKNKFEIGGKIINEIASWKAWGPGIGFQTIYRITPRSGLESGIYYKQNPKYYILEPTPSGYSNEKFTEQDIMVPVLYRYDSKAINFTAGFALDYFLNLGVFKEKMLPGFPVSGLDRWEVLTTVSISKNFYLKNKWILEPEIRGSAFVPAGGDGVGLNVSFRKKLY